MIYIYGLIICICGSSIIVLNKKKVKDNSVVHSFKETLIGVAFGIINIFLLALVLVTNKILVNNKVPIGSQMFYVVISTMTYSWSCFSSWIIVHVCHSWFFFI